LAASSECEAVVQLLIEKGADVTAKDLGELTPLHVAAYCGHEAVVRLLLDHKADINAEDSRGWTARRWAAQRGHQPVVCVLEKAVENGYKVVAQLPLISLSTGSGLATSPVQLGRVLSCISENLVSTSTGSDCFFEKGPHPIPSTFSTCRKDLDPYPQPVLKIQEDTTLPRVSHSAGKREGNEKAKDIPVLSMTPEEEEHVRQLNMASRTRNCMVCAETIPILEFPALTDCQHDPKVCSVCYKSWIASELESKTWKEIKCPESGCGQLLKHAEVQQYATPEVYKK
jgi:hypothetical protein